MRKIAKLSLVVATAITSVGTLHAKDLSEAIKDVDISGTIVYRYDDYNADDPDKGLNNNRNKYKTTVNLKSKVNDDVTANTTFLAGSSTNTDMSNRDTRSQGDENIDVSLTKVNFAYTGITNTTIMLGKQGLATPWTMAVDADGAEQTGTGVVAMTTWYGVTALAGYFNQNNFDDAADQQFKEHSESVGGNSAQNYGGEEDIIIAALIGSVYGVNLDAWYMNLDDTKVTNEDMSFDAYTLGAGYGFNFGGAKIDLSARYSSLEFDKEATGIANGGKNTDNALWKLGVKAKMGIFGASVLYGQTDEDGGYVAIDSSSYATYSAWNADVNGIADASFLATNINVDILPKVNFGISYNEIDADANDNDDNEELYGQLTYKMSSNFMAYVRYGEWTETDQGKDEDSDVGRLQIEYSF